MTLNAFIEKLNTQPELVEFTETMAVIESHYDFTPTEFANGNTVNLAGQNNGSCKIFAFALLNQLTVEQTLACFGQYYRDDVLKNPSGNDHGNIRNFMKSGWAGITFEQTALSQKK